MAAAYVIIGWLVMQIGEVMARALHLPDWEQRARANIAAELATLDPPADGPADEPADGPPSAKPIDCPGES